LRQFFVFRIDSQVDFFILFVYSDVVVDFFIGFVLLACIGYTFGCDSTGW